MTKRIVFLLALINCIWAWACPEIPKNITITGATFSGAYHFGVDQNCRFRMDIDLQKQLDTLPLINREMEQWDAANPRPDLLSSDFDAWQARANAFSKALDQKYPINTMYITNKEGKICLNGDCTQRSVVLSDGSSSKGIISINSDGTASIFSVDSQGKKDTAHPYLVITPDGPKSAKIETFQNQTSVGTMKIDASKCSRGGGGDPAPPLELVGKHYLSNGGGCTGGFKEDSPSGSSSTPQPPIPSEERGGDAG